MQGIFISYPREREHEAERWKRDLSAIGGDAFVCHLDADAGFASESGANQRRFLAHKIAAAAVVVVLWDRNYGRAAWCAWELTCAAEHAGKRVFLVNLDGTLVPRELDARIERITDAAELARRPAAAPPAVRASALDRVALYPAASLLESRFAPRFDARTRGVRELATMIGWLVLSVGAQLAIFYAAARWVTTDARGAVSDVRVHLWALIVAINLAMTIVGAFTLSASAATRCGVLAFGIALAALVGGTAWRGEPDRHTVTIAAAAMGTFHASLVLALRDRLLGAPLGWWTPRHAPPRLRAGRAHAWAALAIATVAVLLVLGLRILDDATALAARLPTLPPLAKVAAIAKLADLPLQLGLVVGFLAGVAVGTAVYRRVLGNYRATAPHRIPIAVAYAIGTCALATGIGYETGAWIQTHLVDAIGAWAGSYAGAQVGVLLAVGLVVPIAAGTGRLSIRQERWWGLAGAFVVIAIIALKVRSFPFAKNRDGVPLEIFLGALYGLAPIALVRVLASVRFSRR